MRGAVSMALAYNQVIIDIIVISEFNFEILMSIFTRKRCFFPFSSVWETMCETQRRTTSCRTFHWTSLLSLSWMQFTRSGHTQLRANAIMITSTITVVLVSTVVRHLLSIFLFGFVYCNIGWSRFIGFSFFYYFLFSKWKIKLFDITSVLATRLT